MDDKRRRFESEVMPHLDAAWRFARWLTRSAADAEDVVQEACLRAYRGYEGLRGTDAKAWLLAIVRNCQATDFRQRQRQAALPLPESHDARDVAAVVAPGPDPERAAMQRDEARQLDRLLGALPPEQREVLVLREIEDMDYRQIAAILGIPIGTVMSRLARARAALKLRCQADVPGSRA